MRLNSLLIQSVTAISLIATAGAQANTAIPSHVVNRAFVNHGLIRMHLEAGAYQIKAGTEDKIHVEWTAKDWAVDKVKVEINTSGSNADVSVKVPDNSNAKLTIELPAKSDLWMRFSAGDFHVEGIEGSKDIVGWAGNLSIDVGNADQYKEVHAAVTTGDLSAAPFHVSKGGLWRSFDQHGTGPYTLRVKLTAGDLILFSHTESRKNGKA